MTTKLLLKLFLLINVLGLGYVILMDNTLIIPSSISDSEITQRFEELKSEKDDDIFLMKVSYLEGAFESLSEGFERDIQEVVNTNNRISIIMLINIILSFILFFKPHGKSKI